jgi:catalase (peroxidase I)
MFSSFTNRYTPTPIKARRPLWPNKSKFTKKNFSFALILLLLTIISVYFILFQSNGMEVSNENLMADNQSLNWNDATTIYQFKIEKLNNKFLYLSTLKNKVVLVLK